MAVDIWTYRGQELNGLDLTGFAVEATDGPIGTVDLATHDVGASYIVVDTEVWQARGSRVVLPAGTIERVGPAKVFLNRTRKEIKDAPPFDGKGGFDAPQRAMLDSYYRGSFYAQQPWESHEPDAPERSVEQLRREARELNVEGRSSMSKSQLERAVAAARH